MKKITTIIPKAIIGLSTALLILMMSACQSDEAKDEKESQSKDGWTIEISKEKFQVRITQNATGKEIVLANGEKSGLLYLTDEGMQYLAALKEVKEEGPGKFVASYSTTDDRQANVSLMVNESGNVDIKMTVEPEEGIELKGAGLKAHEDEHYFGLLERVVDGPQQASWEEGITAALDLRGQNVGMMVKPTVSIYKPWYVSSHGYGVFVHGTWPGQYEMASENPELVRFGFKGPELAFTLVKGPTMNEAVKNFAAIEGYSILPPKWVFGPWRWRDNHEHKDTYYDGTPVKAPYNSMVVEDILMMQALDIPFDLYWVDRPWAGGAYGYTTFDWDPVRFPKGAEMVKWIKDKDKEFMLWIAPWVMGGQALKEAKEKGYVIPGTETYYNVHAKNQDADMGKPEYEAMLLDFSHPDIAEWWGQWLGITIEQGVAGFKLDRAEEILVPTDSVRLHNGNTTMEEYNNYSQMYVKAVHDVFKKHRPDGDFVAMPRAGYTGSQQWGVFWGGDIAVGEYGLRAAIIAQQRAAFMNCPVWGSDIGGYWQGEITQENLARWIEFGAFSPLMEVGPIDDRAPWDMPYDWAEGKEDAYDFELIAIYRTYSVIHNNLKEYTYQQAQLAAKDGTPIVRPLCMQFPDDPETYKRWDQFMYGPDILVGAIWENRKRSFDMYLPEGQWVDAWTGETLDGGQTVQVQCLMHKIPIYTRAGSNVQMGNVEDIYKESIRKAQEVPNLNKLQAEEFGLEYDGKDYAESIREMLQ